MGTRDEIRTTRAWRSSRAKQYLNYFLGIAHNAIVIENLPYDCPKRYFLRVLFERGCIGYGNGLYLPVSPVGVSAYGLPTEYIFTAYNGIVFNKRAEDCVIMRINDQSAPLLPFLKTQAELMTDCDTAVKQNLFAVRTQTIYEVKDQATLVSLQNATTARRLGAEIVFKAENKFGDSDLIVHNTGAEYLGDKLMDLKKEIRDETLSRLGIMYANTNKTERVQSAEVNASVGEVLDNVYVMIDTFNYDCKVGGLPLRMKLNASVEDMYKFTSETENISNTELSKGGEINEQRN